MIKNFCYKSKAWIPLQSPDVKKYVRTKIINATEENSENSQENVLICTYLKFSKTFWDIRKMKLILFKELR